jgi:alpha-methylacyl-CoA racemase
VSAQTTGKGQVVDAAMTDGATSLMGMFFGMQAAGIWKDQPYSNMLDGAAPFYDTYATADGKFISIGSIEPQFYALLREKAGLDDAAFDAQHDKSQWPDLKQKLEVVFKTKTRDQWCEIMEGTDICFAPVLNMEEAYHHPHNQARETIVEKFGVKQPNVAPRFSGTPSEIQGPVPGVGEHNDQALSDWGFSGDEIEALKSAEAI